MQIFSESKEDVSAGSSNRRDLCNKVKCLNMNECNMFGEEWPTRKKVGLCAY